MYPQKLTQDATLDDLSLADYHAIYDELRPFDPAAKKRVPTIREFCAQINWTMAPAHWTNWELGRGNLTRTMRSALRVAVGKTALPPTVTEAVTNHASPDAAVWLVGQDGQPVETVVMIAGDADALMGVKNGQGISWFNPGLEQAKRAEVVVQAADVSGVTAAQERRKPDNQWIPPWRRKEAKQRRQRLGVSWDEVVERGLKALEAERNDA